MAECGCSKKMCPLQVGVADNCTLTKEQCPYFTPTADVVEVVRCKDCVVPHNQWTGCPKLNGLVTPPDFYCSYGNIDRELEKVKHFR